MLHYATTQAVAGAAKAEVKGQEEGGHKSEQGTQNQVSYCEDHSRTVTQDEIELRRLQNYHLLLAESWDEQQCPRSSEGLIEAVVSRPLPLSSLTSLLNQTQTVQLGSLTLYS